ncbi:MAG: extracellular matrix/biofilm biosynthesis regulator RemA family protein [Leptospirales bacterium]
MKLLHIGFSNVVSLDKVVAIISPETVAAKRIRDIARDKQTLIDCTMGRKLRSMILTDTEFTFLSSLRSEALLQRVDQSFESVSEKGDSNSSSSED